MKGIKQYRLGSRLVKAQVQARAKKVNKARKAA